MAKEAGRNNIIGAQTCSGNGPDQLTVNRDSLLAYEQAQFYYSSILQLLLFSFKETTDSSNGPQEWSNFSGVKVSLFGYPSIISDRESALKQVLAGWVVSYL